MPKGSLPGTKKLPYVKWFNLDAEPNYENVTAEMIKTVVEKFKIG